MAELTGKMTVKELVKVLLIKHNLFIKDLSTKTNGKQFVRLAIRDTADNNKLIASLKQELL